MNVGRAEGGENIVRPQAGPDGRSEGASRDGTVAREGLVGG